MTKSRGINRPKWRPDDIALQIMREHFATSKTADIARALGVEYSQVAKLAAKMGLRKDPDWLNDHGGRTGDGRGMGTRFKSGNVPWTKGKKGLLISPATTFKPGHTPFNKRPIGSLRVHAGGYLQIKLTETGYPPKDWVMYHRYVWEQAHGPIADDCVVVFRDHRRRTDPAEITVDVLECITRQELIARHTYHRFGVEYARCVQMRSVLSRQINRRMKETQG